MKISHQWTFFCLVFILIALSCTEQDPAQDKTPTIPTEQTQIEKAIIQLVSFEGEEDKRLSLTERQAELGIPVTSVAIARNWELHWAKAFGEDANSETRLQAASLSKTIAAVGLLTLAEDLGVGIDDDLSADLRRLNIETLNPDNKTGRLRALLSHTNGATVSGFRGYAIGSPLPSSAQIVAGSDPANSDPVIVTSSPGANRKYSGGGYQIAQLWAETITGETFEDLMQRLVLDPVGMPHSSFAIKVPGDPGTENYITARDYDGSVMGGGWFLHPEQAAASLWTTPSDYARFVLALMGAANDLDSPIRKSVAKEMMSPVIDENGMGMGIQTRQGETRLMKSGMNQGYICTFMAFPGRGDVIVTMTNSRKGFPMVGDINRTANVAYGWPSSPLIYHKRQASKAEDLSNFVGDFVKQGETEIVFTLSHDEKTLLGKTPGGYKFKLVKIGDNSFVDPADAEVAEFSLTDDGALIMSSGETVYVRVYVD